MRPQPVAQGLPPLLGPAEQIQELFLFRWRVVALWRLDLNLSVQEQALNGIGRVGAADFQLEMKQRNEAAAGGLNSGDLEIQLRHARPLSPSNGRLSVCQKTN